MVPMGPLFLDGCLSFSRRLGSLVGLLRVSQIGLQGQGPRAGAVLSRTFSRFVGAGLTGCLAPPRRLFAAIGAHSLLSCLPSFIPFRNTPSSPLFFWVSGEEASGTGRRPLARLRLQDNYNGAVMVIDNVKCHLMRQVLHAAQKA